MLYFQMQNLAPKDFYVRTKFNSDTQNQIWMSQLADGHDNFCNCDTPFSHLLSSIFPPGHKDRNLTINQILARDYKQKCRSGGTAERNSGGENTEQGAAGENIGQEEKDFPEEDVEGLLAAAVAAEER